MAWATEAAGVPKHKKVMRLREARRKAHWFQTRLKEPTLCFRMRL